MNNFIAILLAALIYLPGSTMGSIVRIGVVVGAYFMIPSKWYFGNEQAISSVTMCMLISPFIPIPFVLILGGINTAVVLHEIMRMIYCAFLILTVSKMYISFENIYWATLVAFVPNFAIQILEYIHFPGIIEFIRQHYVFDEINLVHLSLATNTGLGFRAGSVFVNPNVYMIIPMLALCVFFYCDRMRPSIINTVLIVCAALSGFLTGSRTSIIVMAVIMAVYYMKYSRGTSKIVAIFLIAFFAARYGTYLLSNSRAFQVTETDSLDTKYLSFLWYWNSTATMPLVWITGSLGSNVASGMDSEWGHIYTWFGVFGIYWYIKYYKIIWANNKNIEFFSKIVVIVCALVSITASVLLCMPIYSFVCMIAFSHWQDNDVVYDMGEDELKGQEKIISN